jgi:DNA-binding XRE family transcriptional regulator
MAEINIDIRMMAEGVEMNRTTLSKKFSGESEPSLSEATRIRDKYFPGEKVEELFDPDYTSKQSKKEESA